MMKSGQIFSSDFLVGIMVVFFILTALQVYNSNIVRKINHQQELLFRESLVSKTDTLLMSPGSPENWNETTVEILGFSTGTPNHINETKVERFIGIDMDEAKELLGFRDRNIYLSLQNSTEVLYEKGVQNWEGAEDIYTVKRKVILSSGGTGILRLVVW